MNHAVEARRRGVSRLTAVATGGMAILLMAATGATTQSTGAAEPEPDGYYTEAQAARGAGLFVKHCEACHFAESDPAIAAREGKDGRRVRGYPTGSRTSPSNLGGKYILSLTWPRTGDKAVA